MTIRPIVTAPDPILKQASKPVKAVDDKLRALMDDMLETMYDAPGIGLAAIQIGVPKRVLVMDISTREEDDPPEPKFFVNPEIISASEDVAIYNEGCLSVPEYFAEVERPAEIKVRYLDYDGNQQEIDADGLLATCIQHEMDHLDGVLFIDYLSRVKRDIILRKLLKARKSEAAE
jgi:peptide deformylase